MLKREISAGSFVGQESIFACLLGCLGEEAT